MEEARMDGSAYQAALFRIAALRVQSAEARRLGRLFFRILNRDAGTERKLAKRYPQATEQLGEKERPGEMFYGLHMRHAAQGPIL